MKRLFWITGLVLGSVFAQTVESPTTVASGEWLLESDLGFANWDRVGRGGGAGKTFEYGAVPILISTGLNEEWDVQFGFDGWVHAEETVAGVKSTARGWGDAWVRAKWNFAGDEAVEPAWALLPYIKFPTADSQIGNGKTESGVALVYGQPLNDKNWFEVMLSVDSLHHENSGREELLFAGVVIGRDIAAATTVYAELLAEWSSESGGDVPVTFGVGISPEIFPGCALDFETLIGVSNEATDLGVALRIVWEL